MTQTPGKAETRRSLVPTKPFLPDDPILAAYVHIPFCRSKCHYCDFCSFPDPTEASLSAYVDALCREINQMGENISEQKSKVPLRTIFFGGGTPTILSPGQLIRILDAIRNAFGWEPESEITLEANPGTVTAEGLAALRLAGFNRLSFGLQAMQPHLIRWLGRTHTPDDFLAGIDMARAAGFTSINTDIMFGLPGQTLADVEQTVCQVLALPIEHLSFYSLIVEENTPLQAMVEISPQLLPDEDSERAQYRRIIELVTAAGMTHYEISNAALPGQECRHNLVYWHGNFYYGFGVSAHAFTQGVRRANTADLTVYLQGWGRSQAGLPDRSFLSTELEIIDRKSAMKEMMLLGLRLLSGVSAQRFYHRFGVGLEDVFGPQIVRMTRRGLLAFDREGVRLTPIGLDLANQVLMEFV
ncbi:MAG: radical SAM family heme chaperone HemW [Clostridiaceae bacterium]|jgi:oxygen-independent coproporphyrinogen-3 oxidase|nr:radical SAM family heme chaperone HemW [Clostridiaceae bacterium]